MFLYVHNVTAEVNVRSCALVYTVRAEVNARQSNKWTGQAAHLSLTVTTGQPPPTPTRDLSNLGIFPF